MVRLRSVRTMLPYLPSDQKWLSDEERALCKPGTASESTMAIAMVTFGS